MLLEIRDLRVCREGSTICHVPQLRVDAGERIAITGDNGSGKTTLLRVLGGLEPGFQGKLACPLPSRERLYVHQSPYLFRGTVLSNVVYGLAARRTPRARQRDVGLRWLAALGVDHLAARESRELSGGEQRRVALARAFATEASLYLLDEPFADLDAAGTARVCEALSELPDATVLIASPVRLPEPLRHARIVDLGG